MAKQSDEITVVFIGSPRKNILFEKLKKAAKKVERHLAYQDTFYLTYIVDQLETVVELIDPGLEHTGAREMAVRKADGAILFYDAAVQSTFKQLNDVSHDFELRRSKKKPTVVLIGNEDSIVDEKSAETASIAQSSSSEGYESEPIHPLTVNDVRPNTTSDHRCTRVTQQQGQNMAQLFGPNSKFMSLSVSRFDGALKLAEDLIRNVRNEQKTQRLRVFARIKSSKSQKSADRKKNIAVSRVCVIS